MNFEELMQEFDSLPLTPELPSTTTEDNLVNLSKRQLSNTDIEETIYTSLQNGESIEKIATQCGICSRTVYRKINQISKKKNIDYKSLLHLRTNARKQQM